jgi:hypothetical protein
MVRKIGVKKGPLSYFFTIPRSERKHLLLPPSPISTPSKLGPLRRTRGGMLLNRSPVQRVKNALQARMTNEQTRIESLPKLAMQIQEIRKELETDPSKYTPTQFSILEVALSTFNYGLYLHLKNTRMLNRYLEDFMRNELSKLKQLVNGQPYTGELRDRIVNTLQRLKHLQSHQIRKERWGRRYWKIYRLPTKRIRRYYNETPPFRIRRINPGVKLLRIRRYKAGEDPRQKVFDKWKRVKLQTLQEKYGGMAFGADMMVGVLEDMEKARREEARAKKSKAEIKRLKEESKELRKQFRTLRRKNKGRARHTDPAVTATTSRPYLHGGLWANFKGLFKVGSQDNESP